MPRADKTVQEAAAAYAARGIPVLPLYTLKDGRCTCGKDCGRNAGKHPHNGLVPTGLKDASTDPEQIGRWFRAYPGQLNIGIVLRDMVAIDEDEPGSILAAGLDLPNGPVSRTGRGHHYLFKVNGQTLLNGRFAPGLDCKTGEAYIVAPPSLHQSGKSYTWVAGHSLDDVEPVALPESIERLILAAHVGNGNGSGSAKDGVHTLFGNLDIEKAFLELEAAEPTGNSDLWRRRVLQIIASVIGRLRDHDIMSLCRRSTWRSAGYTHAQTDEFVRTEIRRARAKFDRPEPGEETFDQVDGEAPQPDGCKGVTVKPRRTDWLWHPYFPAGELALLGAKGGVGKGQATASIVARLTTGILWPDGTEKAPTGHVLWAEAEDSIDKTVVPRLLANRADLSRVTFFNEEEFAALDLRRFVEQLDPRAIVLSPIMSFLPKLKSHIDELAVRAELRKLRAAVDGTLCALIGIAHLNKKSDLDAIERLLGSVAFANFVRSVVLLASDKDEQDMRRWVHAKHNLSIRGDDLLFRTVHVGEDPRDQFVKVEWQIPSGDNIDVDSFFDRHKQQGDRKQSAHEWIVAYLENHGRSLASEVMLAGVKAGHSDSALRNAQYRSSRIGHEHEGFPAQVWWYAK
jgi:Bifunctional DNA primase/polymerase, N-terminal/AAA domain